MLYGRAALVVCGGVLATLAGCRFGGSEARGPTSVAADARIDVGSQHIDGASIVPGADAAPPDTTVPDGPEPGGDAADASGAGSGGDADPDDGAAACQPPFSPAGCDPVCNQGCPALSRCDLGAEPRTGVCIGIWISGEGAACLRTPGTDPCAPRLSCLEGRCRRLCYVDGDCRESGSCCNIPVNLGGMASGFKACGPCHP